MSPVVKMGLPFTEVLFSLSIRFKKCASHGLLPGKHGGFKHRYVLGKAIRQAQQLFPW